ncbi:MULTISPECIES: phage regulatory CII family protein [Grimontia]|uniref:Phage regulatory protein CII (CP76) n=1 Tax=Grimontia marina TaxID=646534 RepID=A0A128FBL1_9GAMM|nr:MULTISPECIES: phage regulatory CII family protein [Grimontia]WRV96383.1 phage regulatory CII family protein [Grimontia sp. NTOU-MAR1]CZF83661.1 Phage regulatory protein CII (CP76) [Grimontia marina]
MVTDSSMCDSRERKQKIWDEHCYTFANSTDMTNMAQRIGITPQMMRNKVNPSQPHELKVRELIDITNTGNETLISGLLLACGMVGAKLPKENESATLAIRALLSSKHAGEISAAALENAGAERLPRTERETLRDVAHRSIRNMVLLISDLENRTAGIAPFLSMSMETIGNGMPLPGLA